MIREVEIAALKQEPLVESRSHLDRGSVASYTRNLDEAEPVIVFDTGNELILADGYHRVEAARQVGRATIKADVRKGSRSDALHFAVSLSKDQRGVTDIEALSAIKRRARGCWTADE